MNICITGAAGLIGSSLCNRLAPAHHVIGIDNNMRKEFFGQQASTSKQKDYLARHTNYTHKALDIRDASAMLSLFSSIKFDAVIHCAAQPSHDKAKDIIATDFAVNTVGTLNLLDAAYKTNPSMRFIFMSTNKVYGDNPNRVPLVELPTRYTFKDPHYAGFNESCSTDACVHSFFGASKLAADTYVQEYGKYLGLRSTVLRLGCVTGSRHAGVKLHGFLSYLVKSLVHTQTYEIIGYKGKQVRDQIHADDVALACQEILNRPTQGEVFNLGGGQKNSASILELIDMISNKLDITPTIHTTPIARVGDHICYITDMKKFMTAYPTWTITRSLEQIVDELISYERKQINE